jgi:hypothetical protein
MQRISGAFDAHLHDGGESSENSPQHPHSINNEEQYRYQTPYQINQYQTSNFYMFKNSQNSVHG